jgi:hypothetical protein
LEIGNMGAAGAALMALRRNLDKVLAEDAETASPVEPEPELLANAADH